MKMEENKQLKRQRDENEEENEQEVLKRQKSFKDIITLLEEEEDEPIEDLSSLISTLQEEISSGPESGPLHSGNPENPSCTTGSPEEEGEKVMRHLLEASDDELGIPSTEGSDAAAEGHVDGGDLLFTFGGVGEGIWEFEDHEAANYYNLLQSEIFL